MVKLTERIPGFVELDDGISICRPGKITDVAPTLENKQKDPALIVFCSWMSAAPKHITKYTTGYQRLFPNTAILLIEAKYACILHPEANLQTPPLIAHRLHDTVTTKDLTPATTILHPFITAKPPLAYRASPSILLHACSNGGANHAASLLRLLKHQGYTAPFDAITLDCSPGKAAFHATARAVKLSLPPIPLLRAISSIWIYTLLLAYFIFIKVTGRENLIDWIRGTLNDLSLCGVNVPRLYVYSKADLMVEAGHVHEHAEEARRTGCGEVSEEVFEGAPHCALLNEDAGRYWEAIERAERTGSRPFAEGNWM